MPFAICLVLTLILWPNQLDLGPWIMKLSVPAHEWCLQLLPDSPEHSLYAALTCGSDLPSGNVRDVFQATGLYHILVVSGSHLVFLNQLLRFMDRFRYGSVLLLLGLLIYVGMCQGQPPIVRAWVQIALWYIVRMNRWHWRGPFVALMAGLFCLRLFPQWSHSLSFWFSWIAGAAIAWVSTQKLSSLNQTICLHLMIAPVALTLGAAHPFCVLVNWLAGPLLGQLLLPACLLTIPLPVLTPLVDLAWRLVIAGLQAASSLSAMDACQFQIPIFIVYGISLQFISMFWQIRKQRHA